MREPRIPRGVLAISSWAGALVALSLAFRAPALVDGATVNSDAAIVGLQARHILQGEWSWFLHGSGYQTSVDSVVAVAFFVVLGATPFALVLSTLGGHILATCLAFATLRRRVSDAAAFVAVLPLVFTSSPLHTYILNPPRQASLTLVFVALYVLDGARDRLSPKTRSAQYAVGGAVASLAVFADPYALLFLPPLLGFGAVRLAVAHRSVEGVALTVGTVVGLVPLWLLLRSAGSTHGETTLTLAVVRHNLALLEDPCFPWLLGTTAYVPRGVLGYVPWPAGFVFRGVQLLGGVTFMGAVAAGGLSAVRRSVPWTVRSLGLFGFVAAVTTLLAFLVSTMVMDLFSSRYLAALVLASPFALAPLAFQMRPRALLLLLAPYLVAAGTAGWLGYGDEVNGPSIVALPGGGAADERDLEAMLEARGVDVAIADYWVAYRLTFLSGEKLRVVPIHAREDRYAPYRDAYAHATRSAYVFDPSRSREDLAAMEHEAFSTDAPWGTPVETLHAGALTAVVFDKP